MGVENESLVEDQGREASARLRSSLLKLQRAREYARELGQDAWSFALEIEELRAAGLDNSDFRWLVCKGFLEHAREVSEPGEEHRAFRPASRLRYGRRSCFVLTPAGAEFVARLQSRAVADSNGLNGRQPLDAGPDLRAARPRWDRDRQELCVGSVVVKRFKVPAPNQEMILTAFEEEGWPIRVDDPIPPQGDTDSRRRLHDTINSLNGCHLHALIRFHGDGSGQGIRWEPLTPPPSSNGYSSPNGSP